MADPLQQLIDERVASGEATGEIRIGRAAIVARPDKL